MRLTEHEILDALTFPGLDIEAALNRGELGVLINAIRQLCRKVETETFERANKQIRYLEREVERLEKNATYARG